MVYWAESDNVIKNAAMVPKIFFIFCVLKNLGTEEKMRCRRGQ